MENLRSRETAVTAAEKKGDTGTTTHRYHYVAAATRVHQPGENSESLNYKCAFPMFQAAAMAL
jgi:hypothetical protein